MNAAGITLADPAVLTQDGGEPLMVEWTADTMRAWAEQHALRYQPLGLMPGLTPVLAAGHCAGTRKAKTIKAESFNGTRSSATTSFGYKRRPERSAAHICSGALPGGEQGVVADVVGTVDSDEFMSSTDSSFWAARTHTVAVVRVPEAVRVARDLTSRLDRSDGWTWKATPTEEPGRVQAATELAAAELAALAPGVWIELHDGTICVASVGAVRDAGQLDAMAGAASALACGFRATAAQMPSLTPRATFPPPVTEASRGAAEGAARLSWDEPPASLAAARTAYEPIAARPARKVVRGLGRLLGGGATVATGVPVGPGGPSIATRDRIRAHLWALTAFTASYAKSRGMEEQDRHEFRRHLPNPPAGTPLRVLRGDLARGVPGWVALWIDRSDLATEPGYGILARADDGRSAFEPASPETLTPVKIDSVIDKAVASHSGS